MMPLAMKHHAEVTKAVLLKQSDDGDTVAVIPSSKSTQRKGQKQSSAGATKIVRDLLQSLNLATSSESTQSNRQLSPSTSDNLDTQELLLVSSDDPELLDKVKALIDLFGARLATLEETEMDTLIETALPLLSERPSEAALYQARRNAEARLQFLQDYSALSSSEVHDQFGSRADNKSALATRWRRAGKVFAVDYKGELLYPSFQFDASGRPRPIIAEIITTLGVADNGWQTALWFVTPNGWLNSQKPIDMLDTDPEAVTDAAAEESEPVVF